jgi:hypothetical protein
MKGREDFCQVSREGEAIIDFDVIARSEATKQSSIFHKESHLETLNIKIKLLSI